MPLYTVMLSSKRGRDVKKASAQYETANAWEALNQAIMKCPLYEHIDSESLSTFIDDDIALIDVGGRGAWMWNPMTNDGLGKQIGGGIVVQTDAHGPYMGHP